MRASQVVFSFFRYRRRHAHIAFILMGFQGWVAGGKVRPGALRLLGCGSGAGFSIVPDLTRYCLMNVLAEPDELIRMRRTRLYRWVAGPSIEQLHFVLRPASGHGTWDGDTLFQYSNHRICGRPFAVLTRARIAAARASAFWRSVPEISRSVRDAPGCAYHALWVDQSATYSRQDQQQAGPGHGGAAPCPALRCRGQRRREDIARRRRG